MTSSAERGRPPYPDVLTPAEWRVVEAVRHGLTNRQSAARQGGSADAVKYHVANALQKLDLDSRAHLRRWSGIRVDSHLFKKERAMDGRLTLGPISQIARTVKNVASSRAWYEDVLGLPHLYSFGALAFFDCDGTRLFLSEGEGGASESILYFAVEDIRTAYDALVRRGVDFINAPHLIHRHSDGTEEWLAVFKDDEGRPLALSARVGP